MENSPQTNRIQKPKCVFRIEQTFNTRPGMRHILLNMQIQQNILE